MTGENRTLEPSWTRLIQSMVSGRGIFSPSASAHTVQESVNWLYGGTSRIRTIEGDVSITNVGTMGKDQKHNKIVSMGLNMRVTYCC